ncbi:MAG TPA: hypothetical protein PKE69_07935 [Pyrinomonadaceae bacterium]|nr:hypothetical protein [Pyrinomonadaceae bacterium]
MASNSEKTHAKNLENLHIANGIVANVGGIFKPTNALIQSAALTDFESEFGTNMQAVNAALTNEQTKVGEQIAAFKMVSNRVSKIIKAAKGQGLAPEFLANLRSTANRLNGIRVSEKTPDNPETPQDESAANHSVSRRSYAGILESLDLLDEQIKNNPDWNSNEADYQPAAITTWVDDLRAKHNAALDAKINTRAVRNTRNAHAYTPTSGILVRMNALKNYAETILDKNDMRLRQLKKLKFVDYSK